MNIQKYLNLAFERTVNTIPTLIYGDEALKFLVTGMKAYAEDNNYVFTDEQIIETIKKGIGELEKAGANFRIQDWTMPR